ncbi:MAG: GAF domain-containing protein [Halothermotrichaceae bacterium]
MNQEINIQLKSLIGGERDWLANLANASALLFNNLENINWAGFYLLKDGELVLGPFQGLPACIRIALGKGVCGAAAKERQIYLVPDVHQFPGHIACDKASASEIVIPMIKNGQLLGVLDIDSPIKARFSKQDKYHLEKFVKLLINQSEFNL